MARRCVLAVRSTRWAGLIGAASLVLGACEKSLDPAVPEGSGLQPVQDVTVANSVTGEQCSVGEVGAGGASGRIVEFQVRCAGWDEPSGFGWIIKDASAIPLEDMLAANGLPIPDRNPDACGDLVQTSTAGNAAVVTQSCRSVEGWPRLLIGLKADHGEGDEIVVGWGYAHLAPVYESWFDVRAGRSQDAGEQTVGELSQLIRLAERELDFDGEQLTLTHVLDHRKLVDLGRLYNHAGNFAAAENAHRQAADLQERFLRPDDPALGVTLASVAINLGDQQLKADANALFDRAESLARAGTSEQLSRVLAYRGLHASRSGRLEQGLDLIRQARKFRLKTSKETSPDIAYSYYLEGSTLYGMQDFEAAAAAFERSLSIFRQVGDPVWVGFASEWLGDTSRRLEDYERARVNLTEANGIILAAFGEGVRLAQTLEKQATNERDAGNLPAAIELYQRGIDVASRDNVASNDLNVEDVAPYLDLLFSEAERNPATSSALYAQALIAIQAPKDRTTGKAIQLMAARLADRDPQVRDLARRLQDANEARRSLGIDLAREQFKDPALRISGEFELLRQEASEADRTVRELGQALQARAPRYGALLVPDILDQKRMTELLQPGEALVKVMVARDAAYSILVTHEGEVKGHKIELPAEQISQIVTNLRRGLDLETAQDASDFDPGLAHHLYRLILGPYEAELAAVDHLIYVPSGALISMPPGVFLRSAPTPTGFHTADWLVREMSISLLPTVGALDQFRRVVSESVAREPFLGIGDPVFEGVGAADGRGLDTIGKTCVEADYIDPRLLGVLEELPETRDELSSIASSLKAPTDSLWFGEQADEANVRSRTDLANYRVIAFATHGLLPNQLRCQSEPALVLTPPAQGSPTNDGLLTASEIAGLNLDADWILLSACNTGGPAGEFGGEALSGLARAFFYAGARSLLVSHWTIASEPTVALTTRTFDTHAVGGLSKAEALRQAQLSLINNPNTSHPAFWSAFTIVGDGADRRTVDG